MELISREEVMRLAENGRLLSGSFGERAKDIIKAIPTVEERKEGHWIDADEINEQLDTYLANCSVCNCQMDVHENRGYFKYCPNCGARMKGE